MKKIIAAFKAGSVDQKDGPYSFFQNSLLFERDLNTVPMTLNDEKKSHLWNTESMVINTSIHGSWPISILHPLMSILD